MHRWLTWNGTVLQVEALDGKFKDVITVATIKDIQGRKASRA